MSGVDFDRPSFGELRHAGQSISPRMENGVVIAVVNNAGDGGLLATERQFCSIFSAAAIGVTVQLKFYSLPGMARSAGMQAHIAQYYENFDELQNEPPDGIVVTGTEPRQHILEDEIFWPDFARLVDCVEAAGIPAIWSCLAAHAAVLRMDGVERQKLPAKLSGIFNCTAASGGHAILSGLPKQWHVPHSRFYGLPEKALLANGYSILSRSPQAGIDMFTKRSHAPQLFLQGHSEYGASALLGEYRRDVARFLNGERPEHPLLPLNYVSPKHAAALARLRGECEASRAPDQMVAVDDLLSKIRCVDTWSEVAQRIYVNWLGTVAARHVRRLPITPASSVALHGPAFGHGPMSAIVSRDD